MPCHVRFDKVTYISLPLPFHIYFRTFGPRLLSDLRLLTPLEQKLTTATENIVTYSTNSADLNIYFQVNNLSNSFNLSCCTN